MCLYRNKKILINVKFEKTYWHRESAYNYMAANMADVACFLHPVFNSQYHYFIFHYERSCYNITRVKDARRHIIFTYGYLK